MVANLGIVDTKKIIAAVNESFGLDLKDYNLTTLRRRFVHLLKYFNEPLVDNFVNDVKNSNLDKEEFLKELFIDTTELFRDPSFWRELREKYLPEITASLGSKIWLAGISSGDELFTLMILLKEANLIDKVRIVVSCPSKKRIERIQNGCGFDLKKMEIGEANYVRFVGEGNFSSYYKVVDNKAVMDIELLKNVEFNNVNVSQENPNKNYRMIIFRNVLIQYNLPLYEKVIRKLTTSLTTGGYLMIGNKETLEHSEVGKKMQIVNEVEKIYRKRFD